MTEIIEYLISIIHRSVVGCQLVVRIQTTARRYAAQHVSHSLSGCGSLFGDKVGTAMDNDRQVPPEDPDYRNERQWLEGIHPSA